MRKFSFVLAVVLLVVCLSSTLPAFASTAMRAEAKAGDPVIDGLIDNNEYGAPFVLSSSNSNCWAQWGNLITSITYRFAWSDQGLYIAFTYNQNLVGTESLLQLVCNPGNQVFEYEEGLFITVYPDHRVMLHNHKTQAGDASQAAFNLTSQVIMASKAQNGYKTTEVLIPIQAFRIRNTEFNFSAGTMAASAVSMVHHNGDFTVGAAVTSHLEGWDLKTIGLGTLTLLPKEQPTPKHTPTPTPTQTPAPTPTPTQIPTATPTEMPTPDAIPTPDVVPPTITPTQEVHDAAGQTQNSRLGLVLGILLACVVVCFLIFAGAIVLLIIFFKKKRDKK